MNAKNNQPTSAPFSRTYIVTASDYFASCIISLKSPRNDLSSFTKKSIFELQSTQVHKTDSR